ncbi:MAG: C4-dicarboxylic acid transporter DauA [Phycisphaera sp.]|nr:C4-dicarboxylic acid transporter DauA [Phycisphaera sp.]
MATAMRESLHEGYTARRFREDALAGVVVGLVAVPLSMALAIASGVPPEHGLYTAIVAGGLIALMGGSRVQVSGPTAAFVVILAPISAQYGLGGLLVAGFMAGVILVLMGVFRFGRLIQFIPHPVTTGFTSGIAVVIATLQIKDLLGLHVEHMPEHYVEKVGALFEAMPTLRLPDLVIGLGTLAVLITLPKLTRKAPPALVALSLAGVSAWLLHLCVDGFDAQTVAERFTYVGADGATGHGIPQAAPSLRWPWSWGGPGGAPLELSWSLVRDLIPSATAIAMLGAIESLLSAVVADGMTGAQHDPDAELVAQGVGNLAAPLMGGIAATGAIARTALNIRSGGRSPVAAAVHAVFVLLAVILLAPLLGYLPMAAMAALLIIVAWNMSEARHFVHTCRVAPRSDILVLVTCFALTVIFDMVVAVSVGVVLASLLFMKRMADIADVRLIHEQHDPLVGPLPKGVVVYEIGGPLFFGAAQRAMSALRTLGNGVRVVVLDLREAPVMDATGLVNLESAMKRLEGMGVQIILAGVQPQPLKLLAKSHLKRDRERVHVCGTFDAAMDLARWYAAGHSGAAPDPAPAAATAK